MTQPTRGFGSLRPIAASASASASCRRARSRSRGHAAQSSDPAQAVAAWAAQGAVTTRKRKGRGGGCRRRSGCRSGPFRPDHQEVLVRQCSRRRIDGTRLATVDHAWASLVAGVAADAIASSRGVVRVVGRASSHVIGRLEEGQRCSVGGGSGPQRDPPKLLEEVRRESRTAGRRLRGGAFARWTGEARVVGAVSVSATARLRAGSGGLASTAVGCVMPVAKRTKPLSGRPLCCCCSSRRRPGSGSSCPVVVAMPTITPPRLSKTQPRRAAGRPAA